MAKQRNNPGEAEAFSKLLQPSLDRIIGSMPQSRTLATLRETLLPKLISGEFQVRNAEKLIEATA